MVFADGRLGQQAGVADIHGQKAGGRDQNKEKSEGGKSKAGTGHGFS